MGAELIVTNGPARVLTAGGNNQVQALIEAVDVSRFDQADLQLHIVANEGTVTAFQVDLLTSMQNTSEAGWSVAASFAGATTAGGVPEKKSVTGLLKYLRWRVTTITNGTAMTFVIVGMARNN